MKQLEAVYYNKINSSSRLSSEDLQHISQLKPCPQQQQEKSAKAT